jgi:hypothetical protein
MHIIPVIVGDERDAVNLCEAALRRGVFAQAIRPPTVAPGTSRLRLAVMASHTAEELREAAHVIGAAARELGLDLRRSVPQATRTSGRTFKADAPQRPIATLVPTAASSLSPSGHNSPARAPFDGERDLVVHRAA